MDNNRITKIMFNTRLEGKRGTGRPKLKWGIVRTIYQDFSREKLEEFGIK
jgi:hypothetical protein